MPEIWRPWMLKTSTQAHKIKKEVNEFFSYHTVDVHASLKQGLDCAVVAITRGQVERSVLTSVAGHKVGVSAHQHAHHLRTKIQPYVKNKAANIKETRPSLEKKNHWTSWTFRILYVLLSDIQNHHYHRYCISYVALWTTSGIIWAT